ncbi:dolichol kinase [Ditylenchus destructor]|nr:dolichol kinase [Ditylenchus destructor]
MIEHVEFIDRPLVQVSWLATILLVFVSVCGCRSRKVSKVVNSLLALSIFGAFFVFSIWIKAASYKEVFYLLFRRIFNGSYRRICVLLFWSTCALSSVMFCALVNMSCSQASTIHRKFFHLTISFVAVSGLLYDPQLLALSSHIVLQIFIIIELLRALRVKPWAKVLDNWLLVFLDGQDSPNLILTPIFLHVGVFMPFLLDPTFFLPISQWSIKQRHFCGVQCVGIGDACAAVIGSSFGRKQWKFTSKKSLEGSLAMFIAQMIFMVLVSGRSAFTVAPILSSLVTTLVEAQLKICDNVLLPVIAMFIYYLFE